MHPKKTHPPSHPAKPAHPAHPAPHAHGKITAKSQPGKGTSNGSKDHTGSTGKQHNFQVPACMLNQIVVKCQHVSEGKGAGSCARTVTLPEIKLAGRNGPTADFPELMVIPSGGTTILSPSISTPDGSLTFTVSHSFGDPKDGDMVNFACNVHSQCSKHPIWTISEKGSTVANNPSPGDQMSYSFLPPVPDETILQRVLNALWLKDVTPRSYQVQCQTCKGSDKVEALTVLVYPNVSSTATLNIATSESDEHPKHKSKENLVSDLTNKFLDAFHVIKDNFDVDPTQNIELPSGTIEISNSWAEDDTSYNAYWGGSLSVALDPIIGITLHVTLVPALAVLQRLPSFVTKYANVDVYLEVKGSLKMKTEFSWKLKPNAKVQVSGELEDSIGGDIELELGAEAFFGKKPPVDEKDSLIYVSLHFNTSFGADGSLTFTDEMEVDLTASVSWGGISGTAVVELWHGSIHKEGTCQLVEGGTAKTPPFHLLKAQSAGDGTAGE